MDPPKILIQLDSDLQPSSFDAIVAFDSGVDKLLPYCEVDELNVLGIVHGAMFTRGPKQLRKTAIFIGGSDVALGERLLKKVVEAFFGPLRVSVMLDSNGSNTTAAAAVLSVLRHTDIAPSTSVSVLGGTGPVGRRIAQICAQLGASVIMATRDTARAGTIIEHLGANASRIRPAEVVTAEQLEEVTQQTDVLFSAGAAGVEMIPLAIVEQLSRTKIIVDVNAVPPLGVGGIKPDDKGAVLGGRTFYGALSVGSLKMKIHRHAIQSLFESNQLVLDVGEIFALGKHLLATSVNAS